MSTEYEQPGEHSWCTDYAYQAMEAAKGLGPDSLSMLQALLRGEGSVVYEALTSLGLDPLASRKALAELRKDKERARALEEENWVVGKATQRARGEGFPLSTDHLLEVIWDEDTAGYAWLSTRVDADGLEAALNAARYPDPDASAVAAGQTVGPRGPKENAGQEEAEPGAKKG